MPDEYGFEDAERLLLAAEFQETRQLWYSSNYVFLGQMCGPDGEQFATVYKPLRGEAPLWDFADGTLYKREVAAYRLSRLLEWPFIPPTVARDGPYGVGAVQVFVKHEEQSSYFDQREQEDLLPQLKRMAVFDYIANNADRKGGHCLLDDDRRVWGIDHGLCFHEQYKMRTVMWDWVDEPIPEEFLAEAERGGHLIDAGADEAGGLLELLSEMETAAMLGRIESLLLARKFPPPGPHRSHPWPLV
ncbi:MAG: SCO1664 family protein [Dehalococcoidia bacterium]